MQGSYLHSLRMLIFLYIIECVSSSYITSILCLSQISNPHVLHDDYNFRLTALVECLGKPKNRVRLLSTAYDKTYTA